MARIWCRPFGCWTQSSTDRAAKFHVELSRKSPGNPNSGLSSTCDISGTAFSCRRTFPCDPASAFLDTMPTWSPCLCPTARERRTSSELGRSAVDHLTRHQQQLFTSIRHRVLIAFILDKSEHVRQSCSVGALERSPLRGNVGGELSQGLRGSRKGVAVLWVQGTSAIASVLNRKRLCIMQRDPERAWTSETRDPE